MCWWMNYRLWWLAGMDGFNSDWKTLIHSSSKRVWLWVDEWISNCDEWWNGWVIFAVETLILRASLLVVCVAALAAAAVRARVWRQVLCFSFASCALVFFPSHAQQHRRRHGQGTGVLLRNWQEGQRLATSLFFPLLFSICILSASSSSSSFG